jgi:hypothetical protein
MSGRRKLRQVISGNRELWDKDTVRDAVRKNFQKVAACQTLALGAEVFASATETKIVPHTCKSKACPSCGQRATQLWQREQWASLPNIPYAGIVFTMPDVLWPIFKLDRSFLDDLPALGAESIKLWARSHGGMKVLIMIVLHTFGRRLNFHPHLHVLVSRLGCRESTIEHSAPIRYTRRELMPIWRHTLITYLREAQRSNLLPSGWTDGDPKSVLEEQQHRWWNIDVAQFQSKAHFLRYAGRYVRRPPISERNIELVLPGHLRFRGKETRTGQKFTQDICHEEFLELLSQHIPERYRHAIRYFDLWGPRIKSRSSAKLFAVSGEERQSKPARLSWAASLKKSYDTDPLIGVDGQKLVWARRIPPKVR